MDQEKLSKARSIVERLLKLPSAQRREEAKKLCGTDPELRASVNSLWKESIAGKSAAPPSAAADELAPKIPGYEIAGRLGQGAMGIVWEALQLGTRRRVAIKLLSAASLGSERRRNRFVREVELAASLEHSNIARVYDSGLDQGVYYYAMELVKGPPLDEFVEKNKLNQRQILGVVQQVCNGVQYAHDRGVVHRDLKPSNILVDKNGRPRILDFGLAKQLDGDEAMGMSVDGDVTGTPMYMSPEQAAGKVDLVDARTDVYTLGVIAYRLLTGSSPHDLSGSYLKVIQRVAEEEVRRPKVVGANVDSEVEAILLKALSHDPGERYSAAGELGDDIRRYLEGEPIQARPASFSYLARKRLRKHRWVALATLLTAVVLTAASIVEHRRAVEQQAAAREADEKVRQATEAANAANAAAASAEQKQQEEAGKERQATEAARIAAAQVQQAASEQERQAAEQKQREAAEIAGAAAAQKARDSQDTLKLNQPAAEPAQGVASNSVVGQEAAPAFWAFAPTPPMGWDSWEPFGSSVTEDEVLANARYLRDHLLSHGWKFVIVDYRWYNPGSGLPTRTDQYGRFLPAVNRFPSAADDRGFTVLARKLHDMGLKLGIHIMHGIPRQSVDANTPIEGSEFTAGDAADRSATPRNSDTYYVKGDITAGGAWYDALIHLYAKWGIDYLKVDGITAPYPASEIEAIRSAIDKCGRPIVLSLVGGGHPISINNADHLVRHANLWETGDDFGNMFQNHWPLLNHQFDYFAAWEERGGNGHWLDADNMPLGDPGPRPPGKRGNDRPIRFTHDEQISMMSLYAIVPSPLILGLDLPRNDEWTLSQLTNDGVLAVNQDPLGRSARLVGDRGPTEAWQKELADGSSAIGLFNRTNSETGVSVALAGKQSVRNLWSGKEMGILDGELTVVVPAHGAVLLRASPPRPTLNTGLVLHYTFDAPAVDGVVKDESGAGNNGRVIGATWVAHGQGHGAYLFNATDRTDVIVAPADPSLNVRRITESAWIKTNRADHWWRRVIDKNWRVAYVLALCGDQPSGRSVNNGKVDFELGDRNPGGNSEKSVADGTWHHIAATYDGEQERIYVDGTEQKVGKAWIGTIGASDSPLRIGNGDLNSKWDHTNATEILAFDGEIRDVRIYNRALSPAEIIALKEADPLPTAAIP